MNEMGSIHMDAIRQYILSTNYANYQYEIIESNLTDGGKKENANHSLVSCGIA